MRPTGIHTKRKYCGCFENSLPGEVAAMSVLPHKVSLITQSTDLSELSPREPGTIGADLPTNGKKVQESRVELM